MSIKRIVLFLFLGIIGFFPGFAQERMLSIDEMFRLAEKNSKSIHAYAIGMKEAEQGVKVAKNDRFPVLEASIAFSYIGDGHMSDRDFTDWQRAPMPHFGNNFAFKASQVVYAGGAVQREVEMSELQQQVSELEALHNRQDIRFLLLGYYLDLFQLRNQVQIYEKNIKQTQMLLQEMNAAYDQGTALKSDITRYEFRLQDLELGLTSTKNRISVLNRQLVTTIGLDESVSIVPDTAILTIPMNPDYSELFWQEKKNEAPLLQLAGLGIKMKRKQEELLQTERRPKIGLTLSYNLDGPILIEVPPINNNFSYWYVGMGFSYRLDALFKTNKKLKQARLATQRNQSELKLTEENLSNAVHAAFISWREAFTRLDTKKKSVQLAHENYEVVHQRYLNGLSLVTDMLDASNILLSSELELLNARMDIVYQYYLLRKTAGDL